MVGAPRSREEEPLVRIAARRALARVRRAAATPQFGRLLVLQATGAAGDALVALALAGSLFFSIPEAEARNRVALYLVMTMAPFSVIAPLLSRILDRSHGGLKVAMVVSSLGRAALAWLLASRLETVYLFPIAFGLLVGSRTALVTRNAMLPGLAPEGRGLVEANATLSKVTAFAGLVAVPLGLVLLRWPGVHAELLVAAAVYAAGIIPAARLPSRRGSIDPTERRRARRRTGASVRRAVAAMTVFRGLVGFLVLHLGFALPREALDALGLSVLVGGAALGSFCGAAAAPRVKGRLTEEGLIVLGASVAGASALAAGWWFSLGSAAALVFAFGASAGASKVAFDSIVQRDTPEGSRGWAFARFESLLQLGWVAGALLPVALPIPARPGIYGTGAIALALALAIGFMAARRRGRTGAHPTSAGDVNMKRDPPV